MRARSDFTFIITLIQTNAQTQVGVFTDPNVAKLRPMKTVRLRPDILLKDPCVLISFQCRPLLLSRHKQTFHSKYMTELSQSQLKIAGATQLLGLANMTSVTS